jgi:hypothetical protein
MAINIALMNTHIHPFRHQAYSSKEKRLCFDSATPAPAEAPRTPVEQVADFLKLVSKKGVEYSADAMTALAKVYISIPHGVLQGIEKAYQDHFPSKEELISFLHSVSEYFEGFPFLGKHINEYLTKLKDYKVLSHLVEHKNWMYVFEKHQDLLQDERGAANDKISMILATETDEGRIAVLKFLSTLEVNDKKNIFVEYLGKYVPEDIQRRELGPTMAFNEGASPVQKFDALKEANKLDTFSQVMNGVLGMSDPEVLRAMDNKDAFRLSTEVLERYYNTRSNTVNHALLKDYKDALLYHELSGLPLSQISPEQLRDRLPPSLFKGALKMGVVDRSNLQKLSKNVEEFVQREAVAHDHIVRKRNALKGDTDQMLDNKGRSMKDMWVKAEPLERLALIVAAGAALAYSKTARFVGGGLLATYFTLMFVRKDDSPGDTILNAVDTVIGKVTKKQQQVTGLPHEVTPGAQVNAILEYLRKNNPDDVETMENEAMSLSLMEDLPLHVLASNFRLIGDGSYGNWCLDVSQSGTFQRQMTDIMSKYKLKHRYKEFFCANDTEARGHINNTVSSLFYDIAARDPANAPYVQIVESAKKGMDANRSFFKELQKPEYLKAREAYAFMVGQGKRMISSSTGTQTVKEFILEHKGLAASRRKSDKREAVKESDAEARERADIAKFPLRKASLEFAAGGPKKNPAGTSLAEFHCDLQGKTVKYGENLSNPTFIAETSVSTFVNATDDQIYKKLDKWIHSGNPPGSAPKGKDPFAL